MTNLPRSSGGEQAPLLTPKTRLPGEGSAVELLPEHPRRIGWDFFRCLSVVCQKMEMVLLPGTSPPIKNDLED
jgi:hypothetical protein